MMKIKLGNLFEIGSGGTPAKSHSEYYNGNISWIKTGDLKKQYLFDSEDCITEAGLNNSSAKIYDKDTVLIAMYGATIGATSILKMSACTNQACAAFKKNEKVIPEYLYYFFRSKKAKFVRAGVGGAQPNISIGYLKEVPFEFISVEQQRVVIEILNRVNRIIDLRKEQLKQLDNLIKSRFVEMFGDPVTNPMEWDVKRLKELSNKIMSGNTPKGGNQVYVEEGITFFRSQNVWKNKLDLDNIAYIDEETHKKMKKSSLKNKDILMTKTGRINTENSSLGRAALYLGKDDCANINGHVYLIRLKKDIFNEFVLFILTTNEYREYIRKVCVGGIDKRQINKEHLEEFPIILPPMELQSEFVFLLHQVNKLKSETQKAIDNTQMLLDSLMQKYF